MFSLNIIRKTRYDEVTATVGQGPQMNFAKVYVKLTVDQYIPAKFIHGPCPVVGGHLVIARFSHYIQREHSITPLSQNQVYPCL